MVSLSKVRSYKPEEIDIGKLVEKAKQIFHKRPFEWQLDVPRAVLCGELDPEKGDEGGCRPVVKMCLRIMTLFRHIEGDVQIIPDNHH